MARRDDPMQRELDELSAAEGDEVAVRRVRERLLGWAQAETTRRWLDRVESPRRRLRMIAVTFATACASVFTVVWLRHDEPRPPLSAETSVASVEADAALWHASIDEGVEKIDLADGTLRLHVKRKPGGKRVIVRVPDGEIEDLGTVFHVVVRDGRTTRVGVDEGSVTMRLAGLSPITIGPGQTWERNAPAAPPPPLVVGSPPHRAAPSPAPAPLRAMPTPPPEAAREDAVYLSLVHALREGHVDEARALARDYLRDFPQGFRREEVQRLADDHSP